MSENVFLMTTDFEQAIICRMILDKDAVPVARGIIEDGHDFKAEWYGAAYTDLLRHYDDGGQWSITSIAERFMSSGVWDNIGEDSGFKAIVQNYHTSADVPEHCRCVRRAALKRRLSAMLDAQARDGIDVDGLLDDIKEVKAELATLDGKKKTEPGSQIVKRIIGDAVSGKIREIETPFVLLNKIARPFRTGAVTLLAGNIGASKTFMLLQILTKAVADGIQSAALFLEENTEHYLHRLWAQRAGVAELTNLDFLKSNADYAEGLADEHADYLDLMQPVIHTTPDKMMTHRHCIGWIEQQAASGCRLIAVDPVSALDEQGAKPWEVHKTFIDKVKKLAVDYECAIILTTHPIKATSLPAMESISGGAAYTRFTQYILWLENHPEKESKIVYACGNTDVEHERTLYVLKSRHSAGMFKKIAFNMDVESLTLKEIGLIGAKK